MMMRKTYCTANRAILLILKSTTGDREVGRYLSLLDRTPIPSCVRHIYRHRTIRIPQNAIEPKQDSYTSTPYPSPI